MDGKRDRRAPGAHGPRKVLRGNFGSVTGDWWLVLRFLNNWHVSQIPSQVRSEELGVRSEGTAHKMRKRRKVLYNEVVLGTI